jgi:hypothetical protein
MHRPIKYPIGATTGWARIAIVSGGLAILLAASIPGSGLRRAGVQYSLETDEGQL